MAKLLGLDYEIQYKKGAENRVADVLSKLHARNTDQTGQQGSCLAITTAKPLWIKELQESYNSDSQCQSIISQLLLDQAAQPQYEWNNGLLKYGGRLYVGSSNGLRGKLIQTLHDSSLGGHSGQRGCW